MRKLLKDFGVAFAIVLLMAAAVIVAVFWQEVVTAW